jgi:hypothetical protein
LVIALGTGCCVFVLYYALALVNYKYFDRSLEHPRYLYKRPSESAVGQRAPCVTVYTHDEAIAKNRDLPNKIASVFREAGWDVQSGRTDLSRHADGIWVHGATFPDQMSAVWALRTLDLVPRIDNAAGDAGLQVIVGALSEQPSAVLPKPTAGPLPTAPSKEPAGSKPVHGYELVKDLVSSLNDKARLESMAALGRVTLTWHPHGNGLTIRGVSDSPNMLTRVTCTIVGLERWSKEHRQYARLPEHYPNKTFQRLQLTGSSDLGLGETIDFGSFHLSSNRLDIHGQFERAYLRQPGVWRVTCRLDDADQATVEKTLCLDWLGEGKLPTGLAECPGEVSQAGSIAWAR